MANLRRTAAALQTARTTTDSTPSTARDNYIGESRLAFSHSFIGWIRPELIPTQASLHSFRKTHTNPPSSANASAFSTKTTTAASTTKTGSTTPSQTDSSDAATTTFGGADETTSGSAAHATGDTTDGAGVAQPGAGLLAALAGVAAVALL